MISPKLDFPELPFDPLEAISFLSDPVQSSLCEVIVNTFYDPQPGPRPEDPPQIIARSGGGPWSTLVGEWAEWVYRSEEKASDALKQGHGGPDVHIWMDEREGWRNKVLRDIAAGIPRPDFPPSLNEYLQKCRHLSLNRECSNTPILSQTIRPTSSSPPCQPREDTKGHRVVLSTQEAVGMNAKKRHEVERFLELARSIILPGRSHRHILDIGSGRAHLSRALTLPPLSLNVLAVDYSPVQREGAEKLDRHTLKEATDHSAEQRGSLEHMTATLDQGSIYDLMDKWPEASEVEGGKGGQENVLVVALHACGDLTPNTLRAFVSRQREKENRSSGTSGHATTGHDALICVGCCYNLLSDEDRSFPMSDLVGREFGKCPHSVAFRPRPHFMLGTQTPLHWVSSEAEWQRAKKAMKKVAMRARLEAELSNAGVASLPEDEGGVQEQDGVVGDGKRDKGRIGRLRDSAYTSFEVFRSKALERLLPNFPTSTEVPRLPLGMPSCFGFVPGTSTILTEQVVEDMVWSFLEFQMSFFWTIRAQMGPVIESLIVLDRFCFLVEELDDEGRRDLSLSVELRNLFNQSTGSLRNLALVVR